MKQLLTFIAGILATSLAFGQEVPEQIQKRENPQIQAPTKEQTPGKGALKKRKSGHGTGWFNYSEALISANQSINAAFLTSVHPDTLAIIDPNGDHSTVQNHSVGHSLDPKSFMFEAVNLQPYYENTYFTWDSVRIPYVYDRTHDSVENPATNEMEEVVDTVFVQFFALGSGLRNALIMEGNDSIDLVTVGIDRSVHRGANPIKEVAIELTGNDVPQPGEQPMDKLTNVMGAFDHKVLSIETDIDLTAQQAIGVAVTFKPGHPYQTTDTLIDNSGGQAEVKTNAFRVPMLVHETAIQDSTLNNMFMYGTFAPSLSQKFHPQNVVSPFFKENYYVSVNTPNSSNTRHLFMGFHLTPDNLCAPVTADFTPTLNGFEGTFQAQAEGEDTLVWDFGDGNADTGANVTHTYQDTGTYEVCLMATNDCGNDDMTCRTVEVECPEVTADFTGNTDSLSLTMANQSTNANEWIWDFGDDTTITAENPSHEFPDTGTYEVCLKASNDCGNSDSTCETYTLESTSITEASKQPELEIYPNPVESKLNIRLPENAAEIQYGIYNAEGQRVKQAEISSASDVHTIEMSNLSSGMYWIKVQSEAHQWTERFVVGK